jgi:sialate O-acetylesterase
MIAPLVPYAIRGVIWYQGESNAGRAEQYRTLFPHMIKNWRADWGQGDFPFYYVQVANYMARKDDPADSGWAELREAQLMTLSLPKTGQAVAIDIGEAKDIHPRNKQEVGRRLALIALAQDYGQTVADGTLANLPWVGSYFRSQLVYSGPIYRRMKVDGSRVRLEFTQVGGGLVTQGGGELKGFAVAGEDKKFVWAQARIEGNRVIVESAPVPNPVAVRYAWADNPECNLSNREGLPASPFRTDNWPGVTAGKR